MEDTMAETPKYHGSLVAFEGPEDIVSTQIRLLPNSSKILILPTLQSYLQESGTNQSFEPRSHILKIHKACNERAEMARTFLRAATPDNKRLVFMTGGTASAQLSCITSISEHETNGDFTKAETIFNELVQNGIAGLERRKKHVKGEVVPSAQGGEGDERTIPETIREEENTDDPAIKAMKAADALDLETAFLQTTTNELDLTIAIARPRPRSTSVPARLLYDDLQRAAPFYVFGVPKSGRDAAKAPTGSVEDGPLPYVEKWRNMTAAMDQLTDPNAPPPSPSCVGEAYPNQSSDSTTTSPAVIEEACVVDVRSSLPTPGHKRLKSVDRIYASGISQDISLCNPAALAKLESAPRQAAENTTGEASVRRVVLRSKFYSEIPRPTYTKPTKTVIRRGGSPIPLELGFKFRAQRPVSYVDQGTNPVRNYVDQGTVTEPVSPAGKATGKENSFLDLEEDFELDATEPFYTVLPMVEDLVVHFKGEKLDSRLEAMIQSFKDGVYPVSMPPLLSESKEEEDAERPRTPTSRSSTPKAAGDDTPNSGRTVQATTPVLHVDPDEYDPFASHGDYLQSPKSYTAQKSVKIETPAPSAILVPTPPTPAQTPPPSETDVTTPFHDFDTTQYQTAVGTQNSLRSILKIYFSPEDIGYNQFSFPLLPELSSLWRPVFRETPSLSPDQTKRKIDLILAIGGQKGVEREFLGAISGSLERLGTKPNGTTRSGRLDLRYLIANAMQAFTAQPLANQTQDNPFSNPLLLATLIIPHLETYMAAHATTRLLLLEYPPEHLSTVLALQRLVGVDLLKVAGIINSDNSEPKAYRTFKHSKSRTVSSSALSSTSGASSTLSRRSSATLLSPNHTGSTNNRARAEPSFSRANFIITSNATEQEIATLISTIWKILIDISTFYIPDEITTSSSPATISRRGSKINRLSILQNPLAGPEPPYAPLATAAVMLGFAPSPEEIEQQRQKEEEEARPKYVSSWTHADLPPRATKTSPVPPPPPPKSSQRLMSSASSIVETIRSNRTGRSQRSKLRAFLGGDLPDDATIGDADSWMGYEPSEAGGGEFADEERKYIPLFDQDVGPRKGNSRKALKWLGLAT